MSIFNKFMEKKPSVIEMSDWLANMHDAFSERSKETLEGDFSSHNMLTWFTLLNTTQTTYNLMHKVPSISYVINNVYSEIRAYFDCLWQLYLLKKYESPEEQEKISKLAGSVHFSVEYILKSLFESNSRISKMLSKSVGDEYSDTMMSAVVKYIHGSYDINFKETDNQIVNNVIILSATISDIGQLSDKENKNITELIGDETQNAFSLKFLTRFDFENCIILPNEFYE